MDITMLGLPLLSWAEMIAILTAVLAVGIVTIVICSIPRGMRTRG